MSEGKNTRYYFISHPNVQISAEVPVPQWPLSELGRRRMHAALKQQEAWLGNIGAIFSSAERKALDSAEILAGHLGLPVQVLEALGENNRSATGFLPPAEFEQVADEFFARPEQSVRGWETAAAAQARIVGAVQQVARSHASQGGDGDEGGAVAILSHGAVGTLLYCHLAGLPISRRWDQPANGGGNFYGFELNPPRVHGTWQPIDAAL
ncbi:histidine phosphatase family protein [Paucibacter sp. B51]|uniref:histidine phosphatase family protein n=1 Tax=Paucibacter sp. B51 TaxID=2993315 RepID=UPI0022EC001F|nr:histidine phosphatase family protein [Paucibacter sp. B51]